MGNCLLKRKLINYVFGISRTISSSSPAWTRTDNSVGKTATASIGTTAGSSDFSKYYPYNQITRVTLSTGDVMVKIPKFYYQRYQSGGVEYIKICEKPKSGFSLHPAFNRPDGIRNYIYVGAYETSSNNRSLSGATPQNFQSRSTMRTNAKNKGSYWGLIDIATLSAIQMLIMVEFANNDVQTYIGSGNSGASSFLTTGKADSVPNLTGRPSGTSTSVAVVWRGIENFWSDMWEFADGLNWNGGTYYVCNDQSKYADNTTTGYTALSYKGSTSWGTNTYIKELGLDVNNSWVMATSVTGGSSSTYYCDGVLSESGWRVFDYGGARNLGTNDGLFALDVRLSNSETNVYIGSRLLYLPLS